VLDHITIGVTDFERSKKFYDLALSSLGIERLYGQADIFAGYGVRPKAFFWIGRRAPAQTSAHIAFTAPDRAAVKLFHETALAAGGRDNGAPGVRPHYDENYYAAFVLDPDGHNIEAVCRLPA
jgi:catechol 2,3-dioxygenase-like lactoylglutathione lyase family enzyme